MRFFNLGASELLLILIFAILAIGPKETLRLASQVRNYIKSIQEIFVDLSTEVTRMASEGAETSREPENEETD